eukprot:3330097-Prymnesium_polylepis.1
MPTTTCCQRPTPTRTSRPGDRPRASREPGRCSASLARRHVTRPTYHYYVIDNLVDEARRQGACHT